MIALGEAVERLQPLMPTMVKAAPQCSRDRIGWIETSHTIMLLMLSGIGRTMRL